MQFDDGSHCHWTYRHGTYSSPWFWPSQPEAQNAVNVLTAEEPDVRSQYEVFQVHSPNHCACNEAKIKEPAA